MKGIVTVNEGIEENEAVGKAIMHDFWERHRASIQLLFCGLSQYFGLRKKCVGSTPAMITQVNISDFSC